MNWKAEEGLRRVTDLLNGFTHYKFTRAEYIELLEHIAVEVLRRAQAAKEAKHANHNRG